MIIQGTLFEVLEKLVSFIGTFTKIWFHKYIDSHIIRDSLVNILGLLVGLLLFNFFPHNIDLAKLFY